MECKGAHILQWLLTFVLFVVAATGTEVIDSTYQIAEASSSGFLHLRREGESSRKLSSLLAEGKRAAMFQSHFEGNLGDQMETIPVLQKLKEWGVVTDAYLSVWMPDTKRLSPVVFSRVREYVDQVYNKVGHNPSDQGRSALMSRNYDIAIIAPGPTVNEITYCFPNQRGTNVTMVWFGISITKVAWKHTYQKHKYCLKAVVVREEISYESAQHMLEPEPDYDRQTRLLLSGDFSFSYKPDKALVDKFTDKYTKQLKPLIDSGNEWVVIFSRENNFGGLGGIKVKDDGKLYVSTLDHKIQVYELDKVVFATSSWLEDEAHYKNIRSTYKIPGSRIVNLETIEAMFGLISIASHVVTDRYHPGVATLLNNKKLTVTRYKAETVKMTGLYRMQKYKRKEIIKMNNKAFDVLLKLINGEEVEEVPRVEMRSEGLSVATARTVIKNLKSKKKADRDEAIDAEVDAEEESIGSAGGLDALGSGSKPREETIPLDPAVQGGGSGYSGGSGFAPPAEGSSGYGAKADLRQDEEEENDEAPPAPVSRSSTPLDPSAANAMKDLISGGPDEEQQPAEQKEEPITATSSAPVTPVEPVRSAESQAQETPVVAPPGVISASGGAAAVDPGQGAWGEKIIPGVTVPIGYKSPEQLAADGKIKDNEEEGEFGEGHTSVLNSLLMLCVIGIVYYALYYVYLNVGARD